MSQRCDITQKFANALRIKTAFPRFQEYFTLTVELKDSESESKVGKMYVGKYFTAKGDFDEVSDCSRGSSLLFSSMIVSLSQ